jgi:transposase
VIFEEFDTLDAPQLRQTLREARAGAAFKQAVIDKLSHENATLKRLTFAATRDAFTTEQRSLLEDTLDADIGAVQAEFARLTSAPTAVDKQVAKRKPLPLSLPSREIHYEPDGTLSAGRRRSATI